MSVISLVAVIDKQGGLGKNNGLLCHLPADLQHFKALTLGKPVIMGRRTFESIGKPLANRRNIILSKSLHLTSAVEVISSLEAVITMLQGEPEVMVIGGAEIYRQFLPLARRLYITLIDHVFDADIYLPTIDWNAWRLVTSIDRPKDDKNRFDLTFSHYEKI